MTAIKKVKDKEGTQFFPVTHERAVRDDDGVILETKLQNIGSSLGDLSELETTDKTDLVSAINEVKDDIGNASPKYMVEETLYSVDYTASDYAIQASANTWKANYKHIVIPCAAGDEFVLAIESGSDLYGWLTDEYEPPTGQTTVPYAGDDNTKRGSVSSSQEVTVTAPEDAAYLCLNTSTTKARYWRIVHRCYKDMAEVIDQKADIEYVNVQIEKSRYDMTNMDAEWETNDEATIYAERDGDNVVITVIKTGTNKRCGVDISAVNIGEKVYMDFTVDRYSWKKSATITVGVGKTLASTWVGVGTFHSSFYFTKTSNNQNYLYIAANTYGADTVITLLNFNAYLCKSSETLEPRVESLEGHDFYPSSYIPVKESYEMYMTVNALNGQGSAVYEDYLIYGFTATAKISIYDLASKEFVQDVTLPSFPNTRFHANTISFSGAKYDSNDEFPLLYICSGYTDTTAVSTSEVYVIRITGTSGNWGAELVQTITLDFGRINGWTEWVCDPVNNRTWVTGSGIAEYICIAIPTLTETEVTVNTETAIIDSFTTKTFALGTTAKSSGQGRCFYHNRIYQAAGGPNFEGEGIEALRVKVDNVMTHCTEAVVSLMNFGLTSEPEGCFIWEDDFYVAYRGFIAKLIQN